MTPMSTLEGHTLSAPPSAPGGAAAPLPLAALMGPWEGAEVALARLVQALEDAPELAAPWRARTRLEEAVALAAMAGRAVTLDRLALVAVEASPGALRSADDRYGLTLLAALDWLDRPGPDRRDPMARLPELWRRLRRPEGAGAASLELPAGLPGPMARPGPALPMLGQWLADWGRATAHLPDGRVLGRLMLPLWAAALGKCPGPFLHPGPALARRPDAEDPALPAEYRLPAFLAAIADSAEAGRARLARLAQARATLLRRIGPRRRNSRLQAVAELALARPLISGALARRQTGLSARGAELALTELVESGALREATGRQRFRLYAAAGL